MTRYWIYDKDNSKTGFPLGILIGLLITLFKSNVVKVTIHRAVGYGEQVSSWDDLLFEPQDQIETSLDEVINVVSNNEEIFYWLDIEFKLENGTCIKCGLHDSSSMYVESDCDIEEQLNSKFSSVSIG
ncbi:hypothetical protein [Gynuella sunshinyii]|uniref:hypothetical protein n=1 Tax=Gynuella sunshinyii TaxID=1445505 RepID=UPI0005CC1F02|nr:hypothetical protein [Gynuella sunshinyii]